MVKKKLIIVESPTKSRTLAGFLGDEYQILATMGHIRDLPKSRLGVDVDHDFKPEYVLMAKKEEAIQKIQQEAKKAMEVILATDSDREGEAIAWHTAQILRKIPNSKFQIPNFLSRITFHEITKAAIEKALNQPGKINKQLVNAQQARRVLDRLVGYKLSPLLWRKIRRGLSAGRVQSVTVRLIVDREREIEKFKPEEYWEIWAQLSAAVHPGGVNDILAKLVKINDKKADLKTGIQTKKVVSELKKANYQVEKIEKKEIFQNPSPPFITSTLQQKAAQTLYFSGKRTMRAAQSLYEKGLITYHRTDSVVLSKQAMAKIRRYINSTYGEKYLPEKPRFYKTKSKLAQEAHEAIRPTDVWQISNFKSQISNKDEERLYELIFKRAVASQMASAVWDQTKIDVQAEREKNIYQLLVEGRVIKFNGWLVLYGDVETAEKLPELKKGDELDLIKVDPQQKFTQPPSRYTEATLIKALEQQGIGRPSTYAPIVSTIQTRQYVEKKEGRFHPTPVGITVNDFLLKYFADVFDYQFTAQMENDLDEIAKGEKKWVPVVREFYQPFEKKLVSVTKNSKRVKVPTEKIGKECPQCRKKGLPANRRGQLVIRVGRFGKFISCSRFPKCEYTAPFIQKLKGVKCPKCGGGIVIKKTKKGHQFFGCSNWPKCKWASWKNPKLKKSLPATGGAKDEKENSFRKTT